MSPSNTSGAELKNFSAPLRESQRANGREEGRERTALSAKWAFFRYSFRLRHCQSSRRCKHCPRPSDPLKRASDRRNT